MSNLGAHAVCTFCDTDFVGTDGVRGGKFSEASALADLILSLWPKNDDQNRLVVLTGGEPLLQVDGLLIDELHERKFRIAVETNGSIKAPKGIDWICVSPKAGAPWVQTTGNELKLVFPQNKLLPNDLPWEKLAFDHYLLQAMDGPDAEQNTAKAVAYCQENPRWRLSLQTHKMLGIP